MKSRKLRLESLEERTLMAVTAGGTKLAVDLAVQNQPELIAVPKIETLPAIATANANSALPAPTEAANGTQYNTACDFVARLTSEINNYFSSPTYSKTTTKDYVVYFAGGVNANLNYYAYYLNMVAFYCSVTVELGIAPENIYILYADGTSRGIDRADGKNSDMTFATSHGTSVYAATRANLNSVMNTISTRMDAESHLLFFTNDHGDGVLGDRTDYNDYLCGWGGTSQHLSGAEVANQLFKIRNGYVTCVFSECFSGGMLDDIFSVSTGRVSNKYTGNAHFYGAAAANHYEYSHLDADIDQSFALGFIFAFTPSIGAKKNTKECFDFAKNYDWWAVNGFEHPWEIGESFSIFTPAPDLSVTGGTFTTPSNGKFTLTTGTIQNVGTATASGSYLIEVGAIDSSTGEFYLLKTQTVSKTIAPGRSTTFSISNIPTTNLKPGGTYYIAWGISEIAGETNLNNNIAVCPATLTVPEPQKPDLTYSLQGSVTAVSNGKFTLKNIAVKNNGKAAANGYTVTVYASEDSVINSSDKVLATYPFTSPLSAGIATQRMDKEISVSGLTEGKTYYIGWIVTTSNDSNPSNNTAISGTITIPAAKTTDVAYGKIGTLSAVENGKFSITGATVKNAGNTNIKGGYAVFVFASPDITVNGTGNDIHLMTITSTPTLNAGATANLQLKDIPTSSLTAGKTYYIGWIVDRVNGEKDTQLANNFATCTTQLTVPAASPDLKANNGGSVTASSKGKFTLKLGAIENLGNKQAASGWKVTVYACTDTKFASSNTINLGTYTVSNAVGARKTREDITVKNINSSKLKSGTSYYFKWVISNVKNEAKADQGNNTARTAKKFKVTNGVVASNALLPASANSKMATDSIFADYSDEMAVDFGLF